MPGPTNTELIRDLQRATTSLEERVKNLDREVLRLDTALNKTTDALKQAELRLESRLAVAERRSEELHGKFEDLNRILGEQDRKRWALLLTVVGACVASVLTLFANIVLLFLRK
jgi:hypothetical protein